jgi:signal transduction histidine kinase
VLALISTVIFAILSFVLATMVFIIPLRQFSAVAHELERGNYGARIGWQSNDEIGNLSRTFDRAISRLSRVEHERKELDRAKTEFLSITSHELRGPMTPMKAQVEMLLAGYFGKMNAKQKSSLEMVLRNTYRLERIILDLLEISRIEAARLKFEFSKTSMRSLARSVANEMKSFMPEKKVRILVNAENLPEMEADPNRVSQVLRNLLSNAIKFSSNGGKIIISVKRSGDVVLFSVQDFGIGIGEKSRPQIFEPFFQEQTTLSRNFGGSGLGLAICKGIVEAQNGRIWFESKQEKGATFHFTLPFTPVRELKPIRILFSRKSED